VSWLGRKVRFSGVAFKSQALSSTAKMGRYEISVVDHQLRVYAVINRRIAGCSMIPRMTTGTRIASSLLIGERPAAIIGATHGPPQNGVHKAKFDPA
jgi:choline dehydrogenase